MPLFDWLLDTTIINAFLIAKQLIGGKKNILYTDQRKFMEALCWALVNDGEHILHPNVQVNIPTSTSETRCRHRNQEGQACASYCGSPALTLDFSPDSTPTPEERRC